MKESVQKEIEELIKKPQLKCSTIKEFKELDYNWCYITQLKISEDFIREFKDKICWPCIYNYRSQLSEYFIYEFKGLLNIQILIDRKLITEKRLKIIEYNIKIKEYNSRTKCSRFELMEI